MPLRPPAGYIRPGYNPLQVANAPTVGTASAGDTTASVAFTAPSNVGGGAISLYYAVSSPGQFTGTSVTSPVTVTGLTNGTSYTFTVWAANPFGPSPYSASSNSVTPSFTYIEDVFSTYLYTGNGSTQTITNGIDLSGKGGLVWIKDRTTAWTNVLTDTARGAGKSLFSNSSEFQVTNDSNGYLSAFNSNGFTLAGGVRVNANNDSIASWTFREQAKFFDVVTYTGNGTTQTINHNLGSIPGCIIVKSASSGNYDWGVYHRSLGATKGVYLNTTQAEQTNNSLWNDTTPTSTQFTVGNNGGASSSTNANGVTYVAYLFAHNAGGFGLTGTDNVISCGSFTTDGSGNVPVVNLGYEPQWILWKRSDSTSNWLINDNMRGWTVNTNGSSSTGTAFLYPNLSNAEADGGTAIPITSTGFGGGTSSSSATFIYIAIRRGPMKTPTTGTSVFAPVYATSAASPYTVTTNFPVDLSISSSTSAGGKDVNDRLRGGTTTSFRALFTYNTAAESVSSGSNGLGFQSNTSIIDNNYWSGYGLNVIYWNFRRAPGFFDEVCYTGTGSATTQAHNLGVVPELMIVKSRSLSVNSDWAVYNAASGNTGYTYLNDSLQVFNSGVFWNSTTPTASVFSIGTNSRVNSSGQTYVAYLFASCPGVSKVGSYTGTGALQTINCGFTGGARFVLIKRTDSTGDWYVYDSARGITSGNDPYLFLNSTAAEVTGTNYVDTTSVGFQVTAAAPAGLNANGGTYIFLAIA